MLAVDMKRNEYLMRNGMWKGSPFFFLKNSKWNMECGNKVVFCYFLDQSGNKYLVKVGI